MAVKYSHGEGFPEVELRAPLYFEHSAVLQQTRAHLLGRITEMAFDTDKKEAFATATAIYDEIDALLDEDKDEEEPKQLEYLDIKPLEFLRNESDLKSTHSPRLIKKRLLDEDEKIFHSVLGEPLINNQKIFKPVFDNPELNLLNKIFVHPDPQVHNLMSTGLSQQQAEWIAGNNDLVRYEQERKLEELRREIERKREARDQERREAIERSERKRDLVNHDIFPR